MLSALPPQPTSSETSGFYFNKPKNMINSKNLLLPLRKRQKLSFFLLVFLKLIHEIKMMVLEKGRDIQQSGSGKELVRYYLTKTQPTNMTPVCAVARNFMLDEIGTIADKFVGIQK